jgi:hypothetical protein
VSHEICAGPHHFKNKYIKEWFLVRFKNGYRCKLMLNSLTGCHECLIWTPSRICGVKWRGQCRKPGPAHFLNVLLATRQPYRRINYELVMQAKTRPKLVPTVIHSPCPTLPPSSHLLLSWNPSMRVKPPLKQVTPQHTHHTLNNYFCLFSKLCDPMSDLFVHYSLPNTNDFDTPGLSHIWTATL